MPLLLHQQRTLRTLVENLLCDASIASSASLRNLFTPGSCGVVPLSVLLSYDSIRNITNSAPELADALHASSLIAVTADNLHVFRTVPYAPSQLDIVAHTVLV